MPAEPTTLRATQTHPIAAHLARCYPSPESDGASPASTTAATPPGGASPHRAASDGAAAAPTTVVAPPGDGPGYWAGGPSAIFHDGAVWLAYRLRRPVDAGRGYVNVVARSSDGYAFEVVAEVTSAQFDSASLERPALAVGPDGRWKLYVSCSTEGSKHWWIEVLDAASPERFGSGRGRVVLPGDGRVAWKDPVVRVDDAGWHLWPCRHHIDPAEEADRMDSCYATSRDGFDWTVHGPALRPEADGWARRGVRLTAVVPGGGGPGDPAWVAFYDGRASAAENWEERTGVATAEAPDRFSALAGPPLVAEPSVRYLSALELPSGDWLAYYEASRPDGAHDLRVEYVPRPTGASQSA